MKKTLFYTLLISIILSACGGARSPSHSVYNTSSNLSLFWQAPTTYTDLTPLPLSEIKGYRIIVGTSEDNMSLHETLNDPSVTEYSFDRLGKGVYYIAVTSYDILDRESSLSNIIIVNVM